MATSAPRPPRPPKKGPNSYCSLRAVAVIKHQLHASLLSFIISFLSLKLRENGVAAHKGSRHEEMGGRRDGKLGRTGWQLETDHTHKSRADKHAPVRHTVAMRSISRAGSKPAPRACSWVYERKQSIEQPI